MSVTATCRIIDLGAVELNDLVSSASYRDLVEMQNFVFRDSRSMIYSFAYSGGWVGSSPSAAFAIFEADIPEGIDQILLTSRGENCVVKFLDLTAPASIATQGHGSPADTLTDTYVIPAAGVRQFLIELDGGTLDAILIEWDAQTIP